MALITPEYRELQMKLHAAGRYGTGGSVQESIRFLNEVGAQPGKHSILDYGCGEGHLKRLLGDKFDVREYDPCIEGKDSPPQPADFVVCADVLEHVEPDCLPNVLGHIMGLSACRAIFIISTREAVKTLEDGRNAHLIVEDGDWWEDKVAQFFRVETRAHNEDSVLLIGEPTRAINTLKSIGVMSDDDRNEQVKKNVSLTWKRIPDGPVPILEKKPDAPPNLPDRLLNWPGDEFRDYYTPIMGEDGIALGDRWLIICGYGPSIADTWDQIKPQAKALKADIVSVSGCHDYLKGHGIFPDIHVECDPRLHKSEMVKKPLRKTKYLMASCCHPDFLKRFEKHDLTLWHLFNGDASYKIRDIPSEKTAAMIPGGGNVLLRALVLFYYLGYRNFVIHGFDCSYRTDDEKISTHAGSHSQKKQLKNVKVRAGGSKRWFDTAPVLISYAQHMEKDIIEGRYPGCQFHFMGDGLFQEMLKLYKDRPKTQAPEGYGRDYFSVPSVEVAA